MRSFHFTLVLSLITTILTAQNNGSVKGTIYDTVAKQGVATATITVLAKKDSSLAGFTMTDNNGNFEVSNLSTGNYRLMVTHVKYHNLNRLFSINDTARVHNAGTIILTDVHSVLQEVVVTPEEPPVTLIDDTIQYNAGSFKTHPNADVEQLLKKMPGISVDKNGTVKAQGQEVKKVLVDGKEFFGTDPKIATKNLPADAVDKVQVYGRLSDAAQLTGLDDGNSEKTINLKLKKDKTRGLFGKATAAAGTRERFEGRANLNSFKGARQISAIATANNTNAEGFSFVDMLNFTGELNRMRQGGNGNLSINMADGNNLPAGFGGGNNTAIKTIWGGGFNYNNIIGRKTDFSSNYFYNHYNPKNAGTVQRQYFLPDSSYYYNQKYLSNDVNNGHRANLIADIRLDSFHSIKISPSIGYQQTQNATSSEYETLTEKKDLANRGFSDNYTNNEGKNFRNDILFRKKFRQKGRTLSFTLQTSINSSEGAGSLQSVNEFFKGSNALLRTDSINQRNTLSADLKSYSARAVYTEPIFKNTLLEFSLGTSESRSTSSKNTYDYNEFAAKFDKVNEQLTNHFQNTYGFSNAGLRIRRQKGKLSVAAGINGQQAGLEGTILNGRRDSTISKTFYNVLPNARLQYAFTKYRTLTVNYSGVTNQPTISQLQPVPDNSNPLSIRLGNPDLNQEFSHMVQFNFVSVNPFRNKNLFAFLTVQQTKNKIVNYDSISGLGVKYTKPVNVNGILNITGNLNVGLPLNLVKGSISFSNNVSYYKGQQFVNGVRNHINTLSVGPEIRVDANPSSTFDLSFTANLDLYNTTYSLKNDLNTTYFSQQYAIDANWQLPRKFYLSSGFTYIINSQRASGFNANVPLWNASISRQFLRFNRAQLRLSAFDLLNKNVGVSRTSNQNYIEDSRVVNLKRFFLMSFTYTLNKNAVADDRAAGGRIRVIRN